jgi:hypothetical protein
VSAPQREREPADAAPLRPYEQLCELAERELELAGRGDLEGLAALGARAEQLQAQLPAMPPPAAAALLQRTQLIQARTRIELQRIRELVLAELAVTRRARRTADGYAGSLRRGPRLDRSA